MKELKHRELIIKTACITFTCLLVYKLFELTPYFINIIKKFISLSIPFIYAMIFAYILDPLTKYITRKVNVKRNISIFITYLIVILTVLFIILIASPTLVINIKELISDIPHYTVSVQSYISEIIKKLDSFGIFTSTDVSNNLQSTISNFGNLFAGALEGITSLVSKISSCIVNIFLGFIFSIYVLIDKERILNTIKFISILLLGESKSKKISELFMSFHKMIGIYIGIKAIDSVIIGTIAYVVLTILKSEYRLLLSIIVGVFNMIPFFGPVVGEIVGFLFNVFTSPVKGITIFIALLIIQMFDGNYLDPKLVGGKVGVRPLYLIFAVIIGGGFFGPIGMLLAGPVSGVINIYYNKYVATLENNK